jgi:hypothetical protein
MQLTARSILIATASFPVFALAAVPSQPAPAPLHYNADIRPILSENCFACHGPDSAARKANLRLDVRDFALGAGAFVPGHPDKSKLIARVLATESSRQMPPLSSHKKLTAAQKETLRRWIAQGAAYEKHWSLTPPTAPAVPVIRNPQSVVRSPIDAFVLARLQKEGIAPSTEAPRVEWLRRVTLDLTGLPPTPEEADALSADHSPNASEKVVDRLLASPRFGERMAVPWLDVARYADSYGYQSDQLCPTWPYRDWVVKAFNDNMPYDRFITEQLAGDLLPNATRESRLATAFNRIHRMTNEGGSVPEEWRLEGIADRVKTFGTAFLGITTECAHCHDHKFDPISQRDYYALSAFFNNIDEYGLYDRADIVPSPSILLPAPDQEKALAAAREGVKAAEERLIHARKERESAFQAWSQNSKNVTIPDLIGQFDFERFDGGKLPNLVPGAKESGVKSDEVPLVDGKFGKAAQLDGENNVNFPALGRFTRHTPFTISFWMRDAREAAEPCVVLQACDGTDAGPHGYDLLLEKGRLTARLFRHWPGNAIAVRAENEIPANTWTNVAVTYDGSSRASGLRIYINGKQGKLETIRDHMVKGIGVHTLTFGQRFRDKGFKGGRIDELHIFSRDLTPLEVAADYAPDSKSAPDPSAMREYYFSAIDEVTRKAAADLTAAREKVWQAEDPVMEVAVMEEQPNPRPTWVLARGRYDAPRTDDARVDRSSPSAIAPWPAGAPRDRLGLARWLTQPSNPLTARVAVNRLWYEIFGRGIVETVEDFGVQGKLPSHPELLDWLARDFVASGWNVKALLKKMVLSSTYRQSSALRPDLARKDPDNVLLARGPSRRLGAEAIRDVALYASGLLDEHIGGPPVSPYQPGDLWREANTMSPAYRQSVGGDLYRRSLYSVIKRTVPMADMTSFDAPSREVCTARRTPTNTPLQALVLLNDVQFVEACRVLAEKAVKEAKPEERSTFIFRRLATREPTAAESNLLADLYRRQLERFTANATDAQRLLKIGDRKADASLPAADVAAATVVAQTILNLDATVWER